MQISEERYKQLQAVFIQALDRLQLDEMMDGNPVAVMNTESPGLSTTEEEFNRFLESFIERLPVY